MARILIGTASWTDPGFVADWYPPKLPASQRLRWYADHFNFVEVNATFYALPQARVVERWCSETPDDFVFDVKLPKALSRHAMDAKFLPSDLRSQIPVRNGKVELTPKSQDLIVRRFLREIAPLSDARKLGAFLLQLSPAFRPKNHELTELDSLWEAFSGYTVAVELRNRDWVAGEQFEATIGYFTQRKITLVLVDAPESEHFTVMPGFDCSTNPALGYLRIHGRNEEGYIRGRSVAERFDYDYSEEEVRELAARIRELEKEVEQLHVVANNNRSNYAPKLARRLQELLGLQTELRAKLQSAQQGDLFQPT
ncbi:MAG: DUF72 domain-containing protein [Verrucomicrobia subdivision 3 bacterium]|nr:DUF72 domain-containing protein [Limisphaerales bacterium]